MPPDLAAEPATTGTRTGATISDIFLARLGDLEDRVSRELDRRAPSLGPAGEFVVGLSRSAWRSASELIASAATADGRRMLIASVVGGAAVDDVGIDAALAESVREVVRPLARRWLGLHDFRSSALPPRGGTLILLNRSGWPLPVEALVLWAYLGDGRLGGRRLAVLWDDGGTELPFVSDFLRKIGIFAASPANAGLLLERGFVVVAFPEGVAARSKTYDRRYRLARFDSGEPLIRSAIESGATIVPGAVVGNEDSYPLIGRSGGLPITAQFPLLGPAGVIPLPVTWAIRLGPALEHGSDADPQALADAVRARMQAALGDMLAAPLVQQKQRETRRH